MTTPTTPAMTAQEALATLRDPDYDYRTRLEAVAVLSRAISDAERRATEWEARAKVSKDNALWALTSREQMESRLSAVEARCGLMREALAAVVADVLEYERVNNLAPSPGKRDCWQSVTNAKSILAYPGGKSDQGEKADAAAAGAALEEYEQKGGVTLDEMKDELGIAPLSRSGDSALVEAVGLLQLAATYLPITPLADKIADRIDKFIQQHGERK